MSDDEITHTPVKDLHSEDGAHELATSVDMQPYLQFMMAELRGLDTTSQKEAITELPLSRRYVWRVASAMKWGFADFDDVTVAIDKETLNPEDFAKVLELLRLRPIQFCMFLKALVGAEEMERIMNHGIAVARQES